VERSLWLGLFSVLAARLDCAVFTRSRQSLHDPFSFPGNRVDASKSEAGFGLWQYPHTFCSIFTPSFATSVFKIFPSWLSLDSPSIRARIAPGFRAFCEISGSPFSARSFAKHRKQTLRLRSPIWLASTVSTPLWIGPKQVSLSSPVPICVICEICG
jgi:hypothetical protein